MLFPDMLMPQGWSLGLEGFFYLLFPYLLLSGKRLPFAAGSLLVFALAYAGRLPQEWFGFRLLPGVLFVFLLGSFIRRPEPKLGPAPLLIVLALAVAALAASPLLYAKHVRILEVLAGLVLGLPIVWGLARARISNRLDALAGDVSYGVFLNHNLLLPGVAALLPGASHLVTLAALVPLSMALAYGSYHVVETPALALRHRLRAGKAAPALEAAAA
jgi:peptidoglycan/LPS O-acetylase OafA/YrhL